MLTHEMAFSSFSDKAQAIAWVKGNIEPDDEAECLTELRYCFYTGVAPSKHTIECMLHNSAQKAPRFQPGDEWAYLLRRLGNWGPNPLHFFKSCGIL
jgi:hypothetical protein